MSISLKAELDIWVAALEAYDERDFQKALELFSSIADSSKILTNMGLIYATIGEHESAVGRFTTATNLDPYLAIAHFQCGVSNFLLAHYDLALLNFEDAYLFLRGNEAINYEQIGLKFKLFSAEILFNKGLSQLNLGYAEQGMADMQEASRQKVTDEQGVIDEAIRDRGEGYTVFSIPIGVLYRPSEIKIKNSKSKDYLGKAKLVAASDSNDAFTEFTGVKRLQQALGEDESKPGSESSGPSRNATAPVSCTELVAARSAVLERSKTTLQLSAGVRPDVTTILASRRSQSVSSPVIAPSPVLASGLSRSNTGQGRSNRTRPARNGTTSPGVMHLGFKTPQGTVSGITGVGTGGTRVAEEAGAAAGGAPAALPGRPGHRGIQGKGAPQAAQQSASFQPGQYVNPPQGVVPLMLPAAPAPAQGGHLTQFYGEYMDVYTDDPATRSTNDRLPTSYSPSNAPSSQRQSPATSTFYQSPAWMQSAPSPVRTSSTTNTNSGSSRAPSRGANAGTMSLSSDMGIAGGPPRRKTTRRPTARRVPAYDDDEGDDGFVTGEYDEFEMANIRVKLHYQGDVRGMTIPPTTTFSAFVARVTTKFGTPLTGLRMKFMDEEGTKISLRDEDDFELAVETARESAKGRSEGKIEVWCVDV